MRLSDESVFVAPNLTDQGPMTGVSWISFWPAYGEILISCVLSVE